MTRLLLLCTLCVLSSCGFHLRGSDALPEAITSVNLKADENTRFVKALRRALQNRGVAISSSMDADVAKIHIIKESSGQRILSVAATDGPEEYEVFQVATFSLDLNAVEPVQPQTITLTRDYTYNKNDILGKRHEYESLRQALADEMAQTVLRRLRYATQ